jgi:RNA polymerase sigma-70 factor (ECF subfamily)
MAGSRDDDTQTGEARPDATRPDDSGVDDATLLSRHVAGDRDAFTTLVERHRDRLWRVALRTLGNPDDAADAVQEALLSAYRGAQAFRGDAAVTTWLHRIVVNACLDLARRRAVRPTVPLDEQLHASGVDPHGASETAADLLAALRQLPAEQAAAVVLVDAEGMPVAEVAIVLGVPVGTVKSRCARARGRLAVLLSPPAPPPGPGNPAASPGVQPNVAGDPGGDGTGGTP